jgi:hypothetical protein
MGIAAYNRGSKAIRRQIEDEYRALHPQVFVAPASEPRPFFYSEPAGPQKPIMGYWDLRQDPQMVQVGDRVFCTVSQCRGWMIVTAVRYDHRHVDIKTDVFGRSWGYGHNFTFNPPAWMTRA